MRQRHLIAALAIAAQTLHAQRVEVFTVTAYCHCARCCGRAAQPTASGKMPRAGVTVAGPRRIPLGTRVRIEGVGERVVQDRLARRYDNRFDVFFASHDEARRFGKRRLRILIHPNPDEILRRKRQT